LARRQYKETTGIDKDLHTKGSKDMPS
jgi:hypothetical protein